MPTSFPHRRSFYEVFAGSGQSLVQAQPSRALGNRGGKGYGRALRRWTDDIRQGGGDVVAPQQDVADASSSTAPAARACGTDQSLRSIQESANPAIVVFAYAAKGSSFGCLAHLAWCTWSVVSAAAAATTIGCQPRACG